MERSVDPEQGYNYLFIYLFLIIYLKLKKIKSETENPIFYLHSERQRNVFKIRKQHFPYSF